MNVRRWWRGLRRKIATWLRAAATRADPGWTLATVTTGRVRRFKELLIDVGLADAYEAGGDGRPAGAPPGASEEVGPMSAAEQAMGQAQAEPGGGISSSQAEALRHAFVAEGHIEELNRIIFELPRPEMASEVPTDVVVVGLENFIPAYAAHTAALIGTASATESA